MQLIINKQIGKKKYSFMVEGKNLHDVVMESQKLSFGDVEKCGKCGSDNLVLSAHLAQEEFEYTSIRCLKCKASLTFGKKKKGDVYFLRRNDVGAYDWQEYKEKNGEAKSQTQRENPAIDKHDPENDDLPF